MSNIFKLIIIFLVTNVNGVLFPYNTDNNNKQTLLIKYYNNANCTNNYYNIKSYNATCTQIQTLQGCCNSIIRQYNINKMGKIDTCYATNKFSSYYYECTNNGFVPIDYDYWMLIIFYCLLGIIFLNTIVTLYCNNST
jgi:hypothetical protein